MSPGDSLRRFTKLALEVLSSSQDEEALESLSTQMGLIWLEVCPHLLDSEVQDLSSGWANLWCEDPESGYRTIAEVSLQAQRRVDKWWQR